MMTNIPPLSLGGHSVNLLDNLLMISASSVTNDGWWYYRLKDPRSGLLANPWKQTKTLGKDAPSRHVSFVYEKDLVFLGGERGTQGTLQNGREEHGEWKALGLTLRKDGSNFDSFPLDACVVRVKRDIFYVMGGRETSTNQIISNVFEINMKEQKVQEVVSMMYPRAQHACAIIPGSGSFSDINFSSTLILVTGGTLDSSKDEIFDKTMDNSRMLDTMNIPRHNHRLVTLGKKLFALGGQTDQDFSQTNVIEVFDPNSESWSLHTSSLLSNSTDDLAVTELPHFAVSCNKGCQCGVKSDARIIGGVEAEVVSFKIIGYCDNLLSGNGSSMDGSFADGWRRKTDI